MATILIVDDEFSIRKTLGLLLKGDGHVALEAANLAEARVQLDRHIVDLVITDMRIGPEDGLSLLAYLKEIAYPAESIMMTAYASIESAVEAMRLGAYDYLTKPINPDELRLRIRKVLERSSLREEVTRLRGELLGRDRLGHIVARSARMASILEIVERIRDRELPVLITGETGTGKEVLAGALHSISNRSKGPFVAINCCTLPEDLLDSELFGHIKGSFTSATSNRKGLFQQAHGGTLFLDEIGDISPRLQANCCASSRKARCGRWAAKPRSRWMCASSPPPTGTSNTWRRRIPSAAICCSASTYCASTFRHCGNARRTSCRWRNISWIWSGSVSSMPSWA